MRCVTTTEFNLQVDGCNVDTFKPRRGVTQGDPLSPYMFIIASEVLSLMIQTHVNPKELFGVKLARKAPVLSHCFFADDAILFLKAESINCKILRKILEVYCKASGQLVNLEKSSIFFLCKHPLESQK